MTATTKPKLLVLELWGVGDLALATPFLRAAAERFDVTLLAKPSALALGPRLWPGVQVVPFTFPWTAFRGKYRLLHWPWWPLFQLRRQLAREAFDYGVSVRRDPRDHALMQFLAVKHRLGFPILGSGRFLHTRMDRPTPSPHRYEFWRRAGKALGLDLPARQDLACPPRPSRLVLVHSGAAQPVRVWPLHNYRQMIRALRAAGHEVQVICDPDQRTWWLEQGEPSVAAPATLEELLAWLERAAVFIGNDSGPGHLAAAIGVPTFTFFGPQLPELFAPIHPRAEWVAGADCVYKPCKDYCRFSSARCLEALTEEKLRPRLLAFVQTRLTGAGEPNS